MTREGASGPSQNFELPKIQGVIGFGVDDELMPVMRTEPDGIAGHHQQEHPIGLVQMPVVSVRILHGAVRCLYVNIHARSLS